MTATTRSKVTPKYKTKYRVTNWPAYERSLRERGDITVWFDEDAVDAWHAPASGLPGGQWRCSDLAIVTALTLRLVFHLPLRQTEGFVASIIRLMGLDLDTPDHTTLSRRDSTVDVPLLNKALTSSKRRSVGSRLTAPTIQGLSIRLSWHRARPTSGS